MVSVDKCDGDLLTRRNLDSDSITTSRLEANDPPKVATFDRSVAGLTGTDWQVDRQVTQCWSV